MFYIKERINDAMEVTVEINDENVFCTCPECGDEVQVDLEALSKDEPLDLFGMAVCFGQGMPCPYKVILCSVSTHSKVIRLFHKSQNKLLPIKLPPCLPWAVNFF